MLDPANDYHVGVGAEAEVIGYCCFGPDARIPGLEEEAGVLDIGLGLRPDLTGIGLGGPFLRAVCKLGAELHEPETFRLATGAFNRRMQRVASALGFERTGVISTPRQEFVVMERAA